ncbi:FKBP-type peptidyl-prolyl cis-trans isomerase [Demequina mangrovi]|uniref:Peptidyl-prolyl cis-trans isomerase n=1 Tax=Demequina mangrovi TaxID=1043493 RepID=A0A1H6Y6L5_9MICO|nr:FKBP-type peptidyl-prolyl cis-trans isomerase [Demequina mangrovi]SEJ36913.1 peptidylprolyl isomerase [Demequina mangrovi]
MKKNVLASVAIGAVAVLGLAACSPASDSEASASASAAAVPTAAEDIAALESIEWTETDGVPELAFEPTLSVGDTTVLHVADGEGDAIEEGQDVVLNYVVYSGVDGSVIWSTYDSGVPEAVEMSEDYGELYEELVGRNVGTDFLYAFPDTSTEDLETNIMAVTASAAVTPLERAEGTAVEPAEGLPTVTLDDTGAPTVDFSDAGKAPEELVAQTLIEGDGDPISEGDEVWFHYTGQVWKTDEVFDSSWARGADAMFTLSADQLIEGWIEGLEGATVGSQVMVVIPPELGYGDQDDIDAIPANSTLVFVVDILGVA